MKEKQPTSAQHLRELFQDAWKTIPGDDLMKLTERMPRACKAAIKARGRSFEKIENIQHVVVCLTLILGLFCCTFDIDNAENDRNKEVVSGDHKCILLTVHITERIDVFK